MSKPDADFTPLADAVSIVAREYREMHRMQPGGWYVLLPPWLIHRDGQTFEQFAARFDEAATRIPMFGAVGFETQDDNGHVRRHRISWLDGGAQTPAGEESPC